MEWQYRIGVVQYFFFNKCYKGNTYTCKYSIYHRFVNPKFLTLSQCYSRYIGWSVAHHIDSMMKLSFTAENGIGPGTKIIKHQKSSPIIFQNAIS